MALRTASKRAYLTGEGEKRQEWGISTVIMNKRGAACPRCLPFVGKVLIDDVWSGGKASDGSYPLMSGAIARGLYHPNCKDSHTTYFEGITTPPKPMTQADISRAAKNYRLEQQQNYYERMARKYKMLESGSLDVESQIKYHNKYQEWKLRNELFVKSHPDILRLMPNAYNTRGLTLQSKNIDNRVKSDIIKSDKQIGKKIGKHTKEYGLNPSKASDRIKLVKVIDDILMNYDEIVQGSWRSQEGLVDFYIKGSEVVVVNNGQFVTILKGGVNNARVKDARRRKI
jgi:hypothetical protein